MEKKSFQQEVLQSLLALEEYAKVPDFAFYLMSAFLSLQRLNFSLSFKHRWLYKFPLLTQFGNITRYAGLFIQDFEDGLLVCLCTIVLLSLLLAAVVLKVVLKFKNKVLLGLLGWAIRLSELLFIPALNINLSALNTQAPFGVKVLALALLAVYFFLVFLTTGSLHRTVELVPVLLLQLTPDLVFIGTFGVLAAQGVRAYFHQQPQKLLYFFIVEGWTALWTVSQMGMPVDLNGSELVLYLMALCAMLAWFGHAHCRRGSIRESTTQLKHYRSLIELQRNKNYDQFRHRLLVTTLEHRRECLDAECRCHRVMGGGHQEQVGFLFFLIEQACAEEGHSLMALQLLADISLSKHNFNMGGLLLLLRMKEESSSLVFRLRLERLILRFEQLLTLFDENSRFSTLKFIESNRLIDEMNKAIEKGISRVIQFWNFVANPHPNLSVISEAGGKYLELVDLTRESLPFMGSNSIRFNYWVHHVLCDRHSQLRLRAIENFESQSSSKEGLLVISLKDSSLGEIENVNQQVLHLTGYEKNYLLNSKVNQLLPANLCDWHDQQMSDLTLRFNPLHDPTPSKKFLLNKEGFVIPFQFRHKLVPKMQEGVLACVVTREVELSKDQLMLFYDEEGRIHGMSAYAQRFFGSKWDMQRKLSYVYIHDVMKDPTLTPCVETPVFTQFNGGKFQENSLGSKVQLIQVKAVQHIRTNAEVFTLMTVCFETASRESALEQRLTRPIKEFERTYEAEPRVASNGQHFVRSIFQLTLLYLVLLMLNKAFQIVFNQIVYEQIEAYVQGLSAFAEQLCQFLGLKAHLALTALGATQFNGTAFETALVNFTLAHKAAQQYGWTSNLTLYSSITARVQPLPEVLIEILLLFSETAPEFLFPKGGSLSPSQNQSIWGSSELAGGMALSNRQVQGEIKAALGDAHVRRLVFACMQVGLLVLFLMIKLFPILGVNKTVGCNLSELGKIDIPRLVEFLKSLKKFEENLNSENQSHSQSSPKTVEHKQSDSEYEEILLDAEERAGNYEALRDEFDWSDFIQLPLVKCMALVVFLADILTIRSEFQAAQSNLRVQSLLHEKRVALSLYFDQHINRQFGGPAPSRSLHLTLSQLQQKLMGEGESLTGMAREYYLTNLLNQNRSVCLTAYYNPLLRLSLQCDLFGGVLKSGEQTAVVTLSNKLQVGSATLPQTAALLGYLQEYLGRLGTQVAQLARRQVGGDRLEEVGVGVSFILMMSIYTVLVLLTIRRLRRLIEISERLLMVLPDFILKA